MTILVAYVPRPEGRAALDKGIEIAKRRQQRLLVVNASPGGSQEDTSLVSGYEVEQVEAMLETQGINAVFKQFVRGRSAVEEINELVEAERIELLVIGRGQAASGQRCPGVADDGALPGAVREGSRGLKTWVFAII